MINYTLIHTPQTLKNLIEHLKTQTIIAVDTESDSLYSYFEKVCLLQITSGKGNYIIDPLAVDISSLAPLFANQSIEKIFHAAEYDVMTLRRDYGFEFSKLFDTMLAARILGWPKYGLGNLLETNFQVTPNKRFQQHNWGQRPLSKKALQYACLDTRYLIDLRNKQFQELARQNRIAEAQASFDRIAQANASLKIFSPNDFWQVKGIKALTPRQQAVVQALYVLRDEYAREINKPPFKVINNAGLINLATANPQTMHNLQRVKGLNKIFLNRRKKTILAIFQAEYPNPPRYHRKANSKRMTEQERERYQHLRNWRHSTATIRGVEPDVILSNSVLLSIVRKTNQSKAEDIAKAKKIYRDRIGPGPVY